MKNAMIFALTLVVCLTVFSTAAAETNYIRATGDVHVRTGPGLQYGNMGVLTKGEQVVYLGSTSIDDRGVTWYFVQFYSYGTGWVSSVYSTVVYGGSSGNQNSGGTTASYYVLASGGDSNIRSGPGLGYDDIGTMYRGQSATYLNQQSVDSRGVAWYYVRFNGTVGWVSSRYTTLKISGAGSWSDSSGDYWSDDYTFFDDDDDDIYGDQGYGFVRGTGRSGVRTGPGSGYDDYGTLQKNEKVPYLGETRYDDRGVMWYKVQYYSFGIGWVNSTYSEVVKSGPSGNPNYYGGTVGTIVTATGGKSNLHTGPGLDYKVLGTFHKGETATYLNDYSVDERDVLWYHIYYNGMDCWVSSVYTTLS